MISSPIFRFLLPTQNPLGFGAVDFVAFGLAILLVAVLLSRRQILSVAQKLAGRTGRLHGAACGPADCPAPGAACAPSRTHPSCRGRFQLSVARRHARPLPAGQPGASAAQILRSGFRTPGHRPTALFILSDKAWRWPSANCIRAAVGWCRAFRGRALRALLTGCCGLGSLRLGRCSAGCWR